MAYRPQPFARRRALLFIFAVLVLISVVVPGLRKVGAQAWPPVAPSGLRASEVNLGTGVITVTWCDNSDNETGFKVEMNTGNGWGEVRRPAANTTSATDFTVPLTEQSAPL
jgi:hypothetical protein